MGDKDVKRYAASVIRYLLIFTATLLFLWLLLVLTAFIPNDALRENYEASVYTYADKDAFETTDGDRLSSVADHYADAIWLNVAWQMGKGSPLTASIRTAYYDGEALGVNAGLYATVVEDVAPNTDYTRYWHGTAIPLRLLHLVTDIEGIKLIGAIVCLVLLLLTLAMLSRRGHWDIALLLILSLSAVHIWNIRLSVEYQPAFILALALAPLYLHFERKGDRHLTALSVVGGVTVAFFDFLTTETVTLLLPLALVLTVRAKEARLGSAKETTWMLVRCGLGWGLCYALTFAVKWTAASLVTGSNAWSVAITSVTERLGHKAELYGDRPTSVLSSLGANLSMLFGSKMRVDASRTVLGLALALTVLLSVWYLLRADKKQPVAAGFLLGLGALVLLRYLVLSNHSYLHCFFTYRALVTPIFALLAAAWLNIRIPLRKGGKISWNLRF